MPSEDDDPRRPYDWGEDTEWTEERVGCIYVILAFIAIAIGLYMVYRFGADTPP